MADVVNYALMLLAMILSIPFIVLGVSLMATRLDSRRTGNGSDISASEFGR